MTFFANEIFEFCVAEGYGLYEVFSGFLPILCLHSIRKHADSIFWYFTFYTMNI